MKVIFIGVGEACDPKYPNTSILIKSMGDKCIMLDCGFTVPHSFFSLEKYPEKLSGLWVSHFHGDHFFGIPLLLLRFWEMGRREPFYIVGPEMVEKTISQAMNLAYPGFLEKLQFPLTFCELRSGEKRTIAGFSLYATSVDHSCGALALKIEDGQKTLFYSGDGRATGKSGKLALGCDLVIHEAYRMRGETPGHGTVSMCLDLAQKGRIKRLALVHLARSERAHVKENLANLQLAVPQVELILPDTGDEIDL